MAQDKIAVINTIAMCLPTDMLHSRHCRTFAQTLRKPNERLFVQNFVVGVLANVRAPVQIVKAIEEIEGFTAITEQIAVLEAARQAHVEETARLVEEEEARSEREFQHKREREFEDVFNLNGEKGAIRMQR